MSFAPPLNAKSLSRAARCLKVIAAVLVVNWCRVP